MEDMMSKKANKILKLFLFISLLITTFASAQTFNDIDAVSSASKRLKIIGGKAYTEYAEVIWNDYYSNGDEHTLKWGTTTSYGNKINLKPFTKKSDVKTKINNLSPDTKYYGQFYRPYKNKSHKTNFTFTTPPAQVVEYTLTVKNGSGSGDYEENSIVDIVANSASQGKVFDVWTGNVSLLADKSSSATTATIGTSNISVTATYKNDNTAVLFESNSINKLGLINLKNNQLTINFIESGFFLVELYTVNGAKILMHSGTMKMGKQTYSFKRLNSGIYFISITINDTKSIHSSIVK